MSTCSTNTCQKPRTRLLGIFTATFMQLACFRLETSEQEDVNFKIRKVFFEKKHSYMRLHVAMMRCEARKLMGTFILHPKLNRSVKCNLNL